MTAAPDNDVLSKVVIIGGMPRSGTNLARRLVGSHSMIALAPVEFSLQRKRAEGLSLETILGADKFEKRYGESASDLFDADDQTAYQALLQRYAQRIGKPIAGEKSPRNEFYYDQICAQLPNSDLFFLHMVRNPFDVVASFKNAPFRDSLEADETTIASVATTWARSLALGAVRAATRPQRYRLVNFEQLTMATDSEANALCDFLEVPRESERMQTLVDYEGLGDNSSFKKQRSADAPPPPKIKQLESRKHHLSAAEIELVGNICGPLASAFGYSDADFAQQPADTLSHGTRRGYLDGLKGLLGR